MKTTTLFLLAILIRLSLPSSASAAEFLVGQKNTAFTQPEITIQKGDSIRFENNDPFFHNIYAASEVANFDLGSYPKGQSKTATFDKEGTVTVRCAIHPGMTLNVKVVDKKK
jgi:plastocyanin